jgi:hypothetical protein
MGNMEIPDELIDQLLGEYRGPEQLTGPEGLINQLRKRLIERAAGAELEQHLGYPPGVEAPEAQPNRRIAGENRKPSDGLEPSTPSFTICPGSALRTRKLSPGRVPKW